MEQEQQVESCVECDGLFVVVENVANGKPWAHLDCHRKPPTNRTIGELRCEAESRRVVSLVRMYSFQSRRTENKGQNRFTLLRNEKNENYRPFIEQEQINTL
jgi:hypothetical protein